MLKTSCCVYFLLLTLVTCSTEIVSKKYRICVIDGKGGFQKTNEYCPKLDVEESKVECVQGMDRFDCLRKIRKGKADFSIFTAEDLIAASNTDNDILITNELRFSGKDAYEEQLVAVVSVSSGIKNTYDVQHKRLCHPGYRSTGFTTEVLTNFLESTIVRPQSCETSLTVPENRILSSAKYFKYACKPGPWVNDPDLNDELKGKYQSLCRGCSNPQSCTGDDNYYGSLGSLRCLTDGAGDISWTTYKEVMFYFFDFDEDDKHTREERINQRKDYRFLCKDDGLRPLNSTDPCTWVAKPWSVIGASRESAAAVQKIVSNLTHTEGWEGALLDLLEVVSYHVDIHTLDSTEAVDSYLQRIPGYLSANSFTGCHPPRTVRICTTSIPDQYKCGWMREAAAVQGIEPDIECLKADNATHCMEAIQNNVADIVIVHPDYLNVAQSKYNLKTLFYETVEINHKYLTVAVVKKQSSIKSFDDLKGAKACFPSYDGVAWNTVIHELRGNCPSEKALVDFLGDSCVPGIPAPYNDKMAKLCRKDDFKGDWGALQCLWEGTGDVAFVSQNVLREYSKYKQFYDFRVLCNEEPCHLSWSAAGQAMVSKNNTAWRDKDILDVFLELDNLFGNKNKESTRMFTMYGLFDDKHDILFNDNTVKLRKSPNLRSVDNLPRIYDDILKNTKSCRDELYSTGSRFVPSILGLFIVLIIFIMFRIDTF